MNHELRLKEEMELIRKGVAELIGEEELKEKLLRYYETNKPLVIKLGLDPSAPDIHLGHTVVLRKIRQFQKLGHKAMIIIGDFTGRIGDPTGKSKTRKQLTERDVLINADTYKTQLLKILDPKQTIICFNSEWLDQVSVKDMIHYMSKQSLFRMLERDSFKKRMESKETIYMHELLYPMLQGIDSLAIEADVELGGMDQKFNILMGRDMQQKEDKEKQVALFMPIIEGLDGVEKMSKSLDNYIGITDTAQVMYEKVMQIPDGLIEKYFTLLTDETPNQIKEDMDALGMGTIHPKALKQKLARVITGLFYNEGEMIVAQERFDQVLGQGQLPTNLEVLEIPMDQGICYTLVAAGFASSTSEARRLIIQKSVRINKEIVDDPLFSQWKKKDVLQMGKKKFVQIQVK